ncbi:VTT domain-containing protein [Devosia sp. FKR38]|uniref:TVP38/TMEM64 family protein n=1 Tax=Devosia sp. FKR38 TaxID=2562312 RepID=UPI0010BFA9EC|nr:VTT domain-containing protein [Devosia sp. FKR38]
MQPSTRAPAPAKALLRFAPLGLIVIVLLTGLLLGWHRYLTLDYLAAIRLTLKGFALDHGWLAALAYVLAYGLAVAVAFPATWLLTLAGGFLYGIWLGGLLAAAGATIGATVLFWAAQTAFGEGLRSRVNAMAGKVARGFEANAFSYLLALRLAPIFPFSAINVLPALFKVPLTTYVAATLLGILPGAMVYASIGQGLETILAEAATRDRPVGVGDLVTPGITLGLLGLALLAAVAPIASVIRKHWAARNT